MTRRAALIAALSLGCTVGDAPPADDPPVDTPEPPHSDAPPDLEDTAPAPRTLRRATVPTVVDVALQAGLQDGGLDSLSRGRACVIADLDGDGREDVYVGNPGDRSYWMRNQTEAPGVIRFGQGTVLLEGELSWSATAADADNDGDLDLFVGSGGNEGSGLDRYFRNRLNEPGFERMFLDGSVGLMGPISSVTSRPVGVASAHAAWIDHDADGDLDLFVNVNTNSWEAANPLAGRNLLWQNNGSGSFVNVATELGLDATARPTRHSSWFDLEGDGDLDLYENNYLDRNVVWRNELKETGRPTFTDVTSLLAAEGADVGAAWASFASASADMNHDGLDDLLVFTRSRADGDCAEGGDGEVAFEGHHLYLNLGPGKGFVDVAALSGLNRRLFTRTSGVMVGSGVMGCQVGDLDANGFLDVYIGNGKPLAGERDHLFAGIGLRTIDVEGVGPVNVPDFADWSTLVDFPAANVPDTVAPYPYRTHGTCIADLDGDGLVELLVTNGGPAAAPERATPQEPARLFTFLFPEGARPDTLFVHLEGDGDVVPRQPVGALVRVTWLDQAGARQQRWRRLQAGSGFSAQNGFDLYFGLGFADRIEEVHVTWPDGTTSRVEDALPNSRIVVPYPR